MHYRGMLRVVRRERGIRIYAVYEHGPAPADAAERRARIDALVDAAVQIYAPLPARCLADLVRRLRFAVPQWQGELKGCTSAGETTARKFACQWRSLVLAFSRECGSLHRAGYSAFVDAIRPRGMGSRPL